MAKIKLFKEYTPYMNNFENQVNEFLKENEGEIIVHDIKYTWGLLPSTRNAEWAVWTAMILYDEVK